MIAACISLGMLNDHRSYLLAVLLMLHSLITARITYSGEACCDDRSAFPLGLPLHDLMEGSRNRNIKAE